ncbi:aminoglycoside adenylyltransferase family protein [Streptomyces flavofungini]|uniref:aminoglycoside adenylyltransferase family protein n=1 Tax=Streptomyces flavofungini TaxID=68200 RepID=UPI003F7E71D7
MTQTDDVIALVCRTLGADGVVGAYPHGSAVLGGLRPLSDLDVLVVAGRRTTPEERRALTEGLLVLSPAGHPSDTFRPVELTIAVQCDLRPWVYPPVSEYQYGEWLREEYLRGEFPAPRPDPDLALLVTMVLAGRTPLLGPAPDQVLDPVPPGDVARAMTEAVPALLAELATDTRNVLLTLARVWTTLATGEIRSKDAAADWAIDRLPAELRPALAHARAVYLGTEQERRDVLGPSAAPLADHVVREIERLLPRH